MNLLTLNMNNATIFGMSMTICLATPNWIKADQGEGEGQLRNQAIKITIIKQDEIPTGCVRF